MIQIKKLCDNQKKEEYIIILVVDSEDGGLIALVLRGDHELNEIKAEKIDNVVRPLSMASEESINSAGYSIGSIGVKGLSMPIFVDYAAACLNDFVCGANQEGKHLTGVNWLRDTIDINTADLRNIVDGDPSPDGKGKLAIKRGIEVGHIFQLGTKYSKAMNANVIAENGKSVAMSMGCYGIGVTRVLAASIEQNFDDRGIIFPESIAPFKVVIIPINYNKSTRVKDLSDKLYKELLEADIEVLLDNRKERAGIMFADSELLGIPHRLVISDTHADNGNIEYKARNNDKKIEIGFSQAVEYIKNKVS